MAIPLRGLRVHIFTPLEANLPGLHWAQAQPHSREGAEGSFPPSGGAEGPSCFAPRSLRFSLNYYPQFHFSGPRTSGLGLHSRLCESLQAEPRARAARRQDFYLLRAVQGARSVSGSRFPLRKS